MSPAIGSPGSSSCSTPSVTRISRLPSNAVAVRAGGCHVRLADEEVPLPKPLGQLVKAYLEDQPDHPRLSPWLFPGQTPGQPIAAKQLRNRLHTLGVNRLGRVAALDQLTGEIPAPVLADLTGYNPKVVSNRAAPVATDWSAYAALRTAPATRR